MPKALSMAELGDEQAELLAGRAVMRGGASGPSGDTGGGAGGHGGVSMASGFLNSGPHGVSANGGSGPGIGV